MATQLKIRRGTTAEHASFTGAEGEITLDTTKDTLVAHDNYTAGGRPMLREDLNNLGNNTIDIAKIAHGSGTAGQAIKINSAANGFEFGVAGKTIQVVTATNGTRTTLPTSTSVYWIWDPYNSGNYFVKQKADTHLRVYAYLPGNQKHSYPYYGMTTQITTPGGSTHEVQRGCRYYHGGYYTNNDIHAEFDTIYTPADCGSAAGNMEIRFGYRTGDGSANRPYNIWNPNSSDDARGYQQYSYVVVTEFYV